MEERTVQAVDRVEFGSDIPPQVRKLPRREREVATILYREGEMTAKEIEERLARDLSNSAVRAMLIRLCKKKILVRTKLEGSHSPTDRRVPFLYSPAIDSSVARHAAVKTLAREHFDGSMLLVARAAMEALLSAQQSQTTSLDQSKRPAKRSSKICAARAGR